MRTNEWFDEQVAKYRKHPDFILEQLTLDITDAVCRAMQEKGLSRSDLARRLEVSPAYITKLLNSTSNVTLRTLINLSLALDLQVHIDLRPRSQRVRTKSQPSATASMGRNLTAHDVQAWASLLQTEKDAESQLSNEADQVKRAFFLGFAMGGQQIRQRRASVIEEYSRVKEWSRNNAA